MMGKRYTIYFRGTRDNPEYLTRSETYTHVGAKTNIGWTSIMERASLFLGIGDVPRSVRGSSELTEVTVLEFRAVVPVSGPFPEEADLMIEELQGMKEELANRSTSSLSSLITEVFGDRAIPYITPSEIEDALRDNADQVISSLVEYQSGRSAKERSR